MDKGRPLSTKEKALQINLDGKVYGSFAEIGAGQEVAAQFFKAGGASGLIAKTMSAYDMAFSDAIYGKTKRYVSRERLMTMINKEYVLLPERLPQRKDGTCFFAMANTVETLNFKRTNQGHGWIGVRFQKIPNGAPNDCILHVILKDDTALEQQHAMGILGVNLLWACFYATSSDHFLDVLMEGLSNRRIEIDMCSLEGPDHSHVDNRLLSLMLVKKGMSHAAMFGPDGKNIQPSEILYKKNILMMRGRFRPVTHVNMDMLASGKAQFIREEDVDPTNIVTLWELTLSNLISEGSIDDRDFLDRVDILGSLGQYVMVSNYHEYYKLVSYLNHFTRNKKIGIILGIKNLQNIFEERHYTDLNGGILEAFGVLFGSNIKMYVYPSRELKSDSLYTCANFQLPKELFSLFLYLFDNNKLEDIRGIDEDVLPITSDRVLQYIREGNSQWENMVPEEVAKGIISQGLFGYLGDAVALNG
ncbi:MAG: TonB-dependent receptor [Bacteroidota bacterium]